MALHIYSVLCERVAVDEDGLATLVRCIDAVTFRLPQGQLATPIVYVTGAVTLVTLWRRSDIQHGETVNVEVRIIDSTQAEIGRSAFTIDLNPAVQVRQTTKIEGMPIRSTGGTHYMDVYVGIDRLAHLPIEVAVV